MTPLPKRKISKGRRDRRRAHDAISLPALVRCPQCHELRPPHTVCPYCGYYKGKEVVVMKEAEKS